MATETEQVKRDDTDRLRELESPICDVRDMAVLCLVAFDHAGKEFVGLPECEYVKVTKTNWLLLSFALRQQDDFANALATMFYSEETEPVEG
jgi:hypothetical protein